MSGIQKNWNCMHSFLRLTVQKLKLEATTKLCPEGVELSKGFLFLERAENWFSEKDTVSQWLVVYRKITKRWVNFQSFSTSHQQFKGRCCTQHPFTKNEFVQISGWCISALAKFGALYVQTWILRRGRYTA